MKPLHCPNPRCSHTFSAAELQRTGVVKCPDCGQEFRFRPPGQSPPQPPPPPVAKPVAPKKSPQAPPPAAPVAREPKAPAPVAAPPKPATMPAAKEQKLIRVRGPNRSQHGALKLTILAAVLVILAGAGYFVLRAVRTREIDPAPTPQAQSPAGALVFKVPNHRGISEKAISLSINRDEWSADPELAKRLKANFAFKHVDSPETWFAVAIQDFGTRNPQESELLSGAVDRLTTLFGDGLQFNSSKIEKGPFAGVPASHCAFRGKTADDNGECYLIAHQGFAYWIFVVAKSLEGAQQQAKLFDDQKVFALTTERRDWAEQPPALQMFSAAELAFSVKAPDNVWHKNDPKSEDESGVIYLAGDFHGLPGQTGDKSLAKNATVLGIALDKRADLHEAFKDVLAYYEKKKQEESKEYRFEPVEPGANLTGDVGPVGNLKGCVGTVKLSRSDDPKLKRFVVVAVFNDDAKTYGLRFECGWDHRLAWQREFQEMIKTVRLGQK